MRKVIALVLMAAVLAPTVGRGQTETPTALTTELWVTGDDGLTLRFADAIRRAVGSSNELSLAAANQGRLVMTIPSNLYWQMAQGKVNFQYVVVFTDRESKYLGVSIGPCWEDGMDGCAAAVVADARVALGKK